MPDQPIKRDEAQIKIKVLPRKLVVPVVSYESTNDISEIDIQQRLDRIFRVIFDEVIKRREEKNRQL